MKWLLSLILAAGLPLFPLAAFAANYDSPTSPEKAPPVAQALVREGDFAVKLAAELGLGNPADEAEAEHMLAASGVAPTNGWISDYPVTPEIIGQVHDSVAGAASSGMLKKSPQEATNDLHRLVAQLNLPAPAGNQTGPAAAASPGMVNNYYSSQGPPIITYYQPPVQYVYLYDWVPYPSFWSGFWFPGFFICHNFTTVVTHHHHGFPPSRAIVSNRTFDHGTRHFVAVDPVVRTNSGLRPVTAFRGSNGRTFGTLPDLRRGFALHGMGQTRIDTGIRNSGRTAMPGFPSSNMQTMNRAPLSPGPGAHGPASSGPVMRGAGGRGGHMPIPRSMGGGHMGGRMGGHMGR